MHMHFEYYYDKFGGNWTTNKEETEGGTMPPSSLYFTNIAQPE